FYFFVLGLALGIGLICLSALPIERWATDILAGKGYLLALAAIGAGVVSLVSALRSHGQQGLGFVEGLVPVQGEQLEVIQWDELTEIRRIVSKNDDREFTVGRVKLQVERINGREFVFDESLSRLKDLRQLIEQQTLEHLLPPARETFESGDRVA